MKRALLMVFSVLVLGLGIFALHPSTAFADARSEVCKGVTASTNGDCSDNSASIQKIIRVSINILSFTIGVLAVVMIMVGGFKYITAAGDSSKISSAKNTIVYAIIGLIIAALSQALVKFVLNSIK